MVDRLKGAEPALVSKVAAQYERLTEDEIKALVVEDKWTAHIAATVRSEVDRVSHTFTGRIRELADRYATPLRQLEDEIALLTTRVKGHLKRMGAPWP